MKLFAIYIGGELRGANIELHDMRFVAAPSILDTHDELRRQWWGTPGSLHIDCWAELDHVDGYDVALRPELFDGDEKLFYVNLGGYDPAEFTEKHKNMFVVATSLSEAKTRALKSVKDWKIPHRDDVYDAEQAFSLHETAWQIPLHLHLTRTDEVRSLSFTCRYTPLKKLATTGGSRANNGSA